MIDFQSHASGSSANLYTVSDGKSKLMIECGRPWRKLQKALDFQVSSVAGALLTHRHGDHSKSAKDVMKAGIDIYMSRKTA